jgi:ABC-2 type transport system permease protein
VALPSVLAAVLVFNCLLGPAFSLAMEREDGTLLRAKAVPGGMTGYVVGQVVYHSLGLFPMLVVVVVPSTLLFDDVLPGGAAWLEVAAVVALGMLATLPVGMVIGSMVPSLQKVTTWGMLPVLVLSGVIRHLRAAAGALGVAAGRRPGVPAVLVRPGAALGVPADAAAALEVGGSWRPVETVLVLAAWSVAGLVLTPVVLRRMARRQSGSAVEAARQQALQVVR